MDNSLETPFRVSFGNRTTDRVPSTGRVRPTCDGNVSRWGSTRVLSGPSTGEDTGVPGTLVGGSTSSFEEDWDGGVEGE